MEIDIFTACDNVQDYNGKLVIAGTFQQVNGNALPIKLDNMGVVCAVRFSPNEIVNSQFELRFISANGSPFAIPIKGQIDISETKSNTHQTLNIAINVRDVLFTGKGIHYIEFVLGDTIQKRIPISVVINS